MNLLDLYVKVGVDDQASSQIETLGGKITSKLGSAVKTVGKVMAGVAAGAGAGAIAITKAAVDSYASYEQLVGGVDKLYQGASGKLQQYAQDAYKTAGMSANSYMEQATSFSAALINSLGGDVDKAADQTDKAMRLMSDNINTFGTDAEAVQNAIQGLSRANFTMLDNLKLGYAGTKQGMENLIADAEKYAQTVKGMGFDEYAEQMKETGLSADELRKRYDELTNSTDLSIDSFSDMIDAIDIIQEKQHIMGTTSREAMSTIEGSVNMTKAAWENFLTAIGTGDEDKIRSAVMGMIQGIFGTWDDEAGKRVGGIINNVAPVVQRIGSAILTELPSVASSIGYEFVELMLQSFGQGLDVDGIMSDLEMSMQTAFDRIQAVLDGFGAAWDSFSATVDTGYLTLMLEHLQAAGEQLWAFVESSILPNMPAIGEAVGTVANFLMDVINSVMNLTSALAPFLPAILGAVAAVQGFMAAQGLIAFFTGLGGAITSLTTIMATFGGPVATIAAALGGWPVLIAAVVGAIVAFIASNEDAREAISNAWQAICDWFAGLPEFFAGVWESIKTATGEAWTRIKELVLNALKAKVEQIRQKMQEAKQTITDKWTEIVEWVRGIPGRIRNALGNLGNTLKSAGRSIISGFLSGLKAKFAEVQDWVSGIGSWIASHKGPKQYDLGLLVNNGAWIMDGLYKGLEKGFEGQVVPYVDSMADRLQQEVGLGMPSMTYKTAKVQQQTTMTVRDEAVVGVLTAILAAIPEQVTLDSKTLVGALAPDMNRALGAL